MTHNPFPTDTLAELLGANFSLFPLTPSRKEPLGKWERWQSERADEDQVARWLTAENQSNFGIATGAVSGVVVLDLDNADAALEAERRGLPDTVEAVTPRGRHLFFAHSGEPFPNIVGGPKGGDILPLGIDTRGDGGYVVAAGSYFVPTAEEIADGKLEGPYGWREGHAPDEMEFAPLPPWLASVHSTWLAKKVADDSPPAASSPKSMASLERTNAWAQAALEAECENVATAPTGSRNDTLNRAAYAIAQIVAGSSLDGPSARSELEAAARLCGLGSGEIRATLNSGWKAGSREPRTAPESDRFAPMMSSIVVAPPAPIADPLGDMTSAADIQGMTIPDRRWLIDGWLPVGACTGLFGDGGTGKTLLSQQMATAVASGTPLFGCDTTRAKVLAFYCEDDAEELARRQQSICSTMDVQSADLTGFLYQSRFGLESLLGQIDKRTGAFNTNSLFDAIRDKAKATGARLVILDNALHLFGDNINDPGAVTRFMAAMNRLALDIDGAVLLLGHIAKAEGSKFAGTAAWSNASRNRLFLGKPETLEAARNPDLRVLERAKANYARSGEELSLVYHRGAFLRPQDIDPAENAGTAQDAMDNFDFLKRLDELTSEEQPLSIRPQARNYAPRLMATGNLYRDKSKEWERRFTHAMGRLLTNGVVVPDAPLPFRKADRKEAYGLARKSAVQSAVQCGSVIEDVGKSEENPLESMDYAAVQLLEEKCGSDAVQCGSVMENPLESYGYDAVQSAVQFPHTPIGYVSPPEGAATIPSNPNKLASSKSRVLDDIMARVKRNQRE